MTAVEDVRTAAADVAAAAPDASRGAARGAAVAAVSDRTLDLAVLAFAAWTLAYHACLVLRLGVGWAAAAALAALPGCVALATRAPETSPDRPHPRRSFTARGRTPRAAPAAALLAVLGAALFGFTPAPWWVIWPLWVGAAGATAGTAWRRRDDTRPHRDGPPRVGAAVALAWAAMLAGLSLVLTRTDGDDAQYVRLASWIAAHGRFPVRDTLFTDEALPAIFFPPLSALEPLAGTAARLAGVAAPSVVYLAIPPVAGALAALATWRLLRAWRTRPVGVALSAALLFLLWDGAEPQALGDMFVGRIWQGKILFAAVLVPVVLASMHEYARRPSRRGLARLAAGGIAGVGLSTTGVFVLPLVAAGALGAAGRGSRRAAAVGIAAVLAYPAGAALVSLAGGTRNAQAYSDAQSDPAWLTGLVFGHGTPAFAAVLLLLGGALAIRRVQPARMIAVVALLVVVLLAPGVPRAIFHLTDLGQILWRITWAVPIGALAGAAVAAGLSRVRSPVRRLVPAAALLAALLVWGVPVWDAPGSLGVAAPGYKRTQASVDGARLALAAARPGDVVLAPQPVSETLLVLSGDVYVVAPRPFYVTALARVPGGQAPERVRLLAFTDLGVDAPGFDAAATVRALHALGVDVACVPPSHDRALAVLRRAGYRDPSRTAQLTCLRAR